MTLLLVAVAAAAVLWRPRRHRKPSDGCQGPTDADIVAMAATACLIDARANGCTCNPTITPHRVPGGVTVAVEHDALCPIIQRKVAQWN